MSKDATIFEPRRAFCHEQLSEFRKHVEKIPNLPTLPRLCIYVTGSYGRSEASKYSDLDLFFVQDGSRESPISKIEKTLLDASLIGIVRDMELPEFSGYGEYLEIHYLEDMLQHLGSPQDDYENLFTARLLLLLESQMIYNNDIYRVIIKRIIETYYRDYHDHEKNFKPIFLVNDIIRFWKTLCLNYEHKRNRQDQEKEIKNKAHLHNLKLKYSRMLTCYSAVAMLCASGTVLQPEDIYEIVQATPSKRLEKLKGHGREAAQVVERLLSQYGWFLERTGRDKNAQIDWIADRENRDEAFSKARDFGAEMYKLLERVTEGSDTLRYVVI